MYTWPGNVRELERFIERAVALTESNHIELDDLPPQLRGEYLEVLGPSMAAGESMRAWGSRYARLVFERCGRNKRRACRCSISAITRSKPTFGYTQQGHRHEPAVARVGPLRERRRPMYRRPPQCTRAARAVTFPLCGSVLSRRSGRATAVQRGVCGRAWRRTALRLIATSSATVDALTPVLLLQLFVASLVSGLLRTAVLRFAAHVRHAALANCDRNTCLVSILPASSAGCLLACSKWQRIAVGRGCR
jgi:hypothetical protein